MEKHCLHASSLLMLRSLPYRPQGHLTLETMMLYGNVYVRSLSTAIVSQLASARDSSNRTYARKILSLYIFELFIKNLYVGQ